MKPSVWFDKLTTNGVKISLYIIIISPFNCAAIFDYDRAISAVQHGDMQKAQSLLTNLVIDYPDTPDLIYDLGVTSFKQQQYQQAAAYFVNAATQITSSSDLKERAYFNAGNSYVKTKELEKAIEQYEKALNINPHNEQTQHNLKKVKEMLEQQKQQEQQQKNNDQSQQDQQENNDDNNSQQKNGDKGQENDQNGQDKQDGQQQDGTQQGSGNNNDKNSDKESGNNNGSDDSGDDGQQEQQSAGDRPQEHNGGNDKRDLKTDKGQDKGESRGDKKDNQQSSDQQNGQSSQSTSNGAGSKQDREQQQKQGNQTAHQGPQQQDSSKQSMAQAGKSHESDAVEKMDAWLAHLLQEQEKNDAQSNKKLLNYALEKGTTHEGANNW